MKTKLKLFGLSLVLSHLVILPATVGAESAVPLGDKGKKIVEQIQDLELLRRNIEACYHREKGITSEARIVRLSGPNLAGLDGALLNRVFGHLAGTPEYERFVTEYRKLIQRPDYRRLHTDELFAEYLRLLESGRIRFLTQLKAWQAGSGERCAAQTHERPDQTAPMTVTFGNLRASQKTGSRRLVPAAIRLQAQMPLSGFAPSTGGQEVVSSLVVVPWMDQSPLPSSEAPAIDMAELNTPVRQERVVSSEKNSMGHYSGLDRSVRLGARTNPKFSNAVEKSVEAVGAWDEQQRNSSVDRSTGPIPTPWRLALPVSPFAQGSPEAGIPEQKVREALLPVDAQVKHGEFAILLGSGTVTNGRAAAQGALRRTENEDKEGRP